MLDNQNVDLSSGANNERNASFFGVNQLPDVIGIVKAKLQQAASSTDLFAQVLGDKANSVEIQSVI
jgi:hypothetical protein